LCRRVISDGGWSPAFAPTRFKLFPPVERAYFRLLLGPSSDTLCQFVDTLRSLIELPQLLFR
jgi:hypothetical protein